MVRRRRSWLTAARTCSTFEGVVAVLGRLDQSSLAVEVLQFLKRPNHSKVRLRLMHESPKACFNISEVSLLFYLISHRTWCTPFIRQHPPYRRYQKIAEDYAIHTQRHVQQSNASTSNHATLHTHSQDTTATHLGKLVNYKRLACYEHCPGAFGYTYLYVFP